MMTIAIAVCLEDIAIEEDLHGIAATRQNMIPNVPEKTIRTIPPLDSLLVRIAYAPSALANNKKSMLTSSEYYSLKSDIDVVQFIHFQRATTFPFSQGPQSHPVFLLCGQNIHWTGILFSGTWIIRLILPSQEVYTFPDNLRII